MTELFATIWPWATATAVFATDAAATFHIVFHHRENRSALGWLGLVWFVPFGGAVLYALFGINRIARKARRLRRRVLGGEPVDKVVPAQPAGATGVEALQHLVGIVTG